MGYNIIILNSSQKMSTMQVGQIDMISDKYRMRKTKEDCFKGESHVAEVHISKISKYGITTLFIACTRNHEASSPGHSQFLMLHVEKREGLVREITCVTSPR